MQVGGFVFSDIESIEWKILQVDHSVFCAFVLFHGLFRDRLIYRLHSSISKICADALEPQYKTNK